MLDQIMQYIGENTMLAAMAAGTVVLFLLLLLLFQVTRTKRELHKICKKVQNYFEVILAEDVTEQKEEIVQANEMQMPFVPGAVQEEYTKQEEQQGAEDIKLLMEVISEVF